MTVEKLLDLGIALLTLIKVSPGKEIIFSNGMVEVKSNPGGYGMTLAVIERAIEKTSMVDDSE